MSTVTSATTGKLAVILLLMQSVTAGAVDVKVIGSSGVASVVGELGRQFEAATGHKVQSDYAVVAVSKRKIDAGAPFDVAILSPAAIDELIEKGKIVGDTRSRFGRTGLGVAARKGSAKPDISTADAFKRVMLAASSVGHSKEGLSGVQFLAVLERLGIAGEMKGKLKTYEGTGLARGLAAGEVELGVTGTGPLLATPTVEFLGPLPREIQTYVVFVAGVSSSAQDPAASKALLQFMIAPDAAAVFKAKGLEQD
jgi:molybdate transport system substrate-binding protein